MAATPLLPARRGHQEANADRGEKAHPGQIDDDIALAAGRHEGKTGIDGLRAVNIHSTFKRDALDLTLEGGCFESHF
jgi:hypothetical protein